MVLAALTIVLDALTTVWNILTMVLDKVILVLMPEGLAKPNPMGLMYMLTQMPINC